LKRFIISILVAASFCAFYTAAAQDYEAPAVEISQEKVKLGGREYYVHKVLPKQTIYSICHVYGVTETELLEHNPSLKDGLKANSLIVIPIVDKSAQPKVEENAYHNDATTEQIVPDENRDYTEHVVKWYETINSIARKYDVSVESIMKNNNLSDKTLHSRQILKIYPEEEVGDEDDAADVKDVAADDTDKTEEIKPKTDDEVEDLGSIDEYSASREIARLKKRQRYNQSDPMRITLILPFKAQTSTPSSNYFDFYSGALIAINEMKESGVSISLRVIDLSAHSWIGELFEGESLQRSDIIIGPVEASDIPEFAKFCRINKIPFVSPMDHKADSLAIDNPYFFQLPAPVATQQHNFAQKIKPAAGERVMLFSNSRDAKSRKEMIDLLNEEGIHFKQIEYSMVRGRTIIDSLKRTSSKTTTNKVIVASEDEAFASDVVRNMKLMSIASYPVELFGSAKLRRFNTIDVDELYDVNYHFNTSYYVDYGDPRVRSFVLKYRALCKTEPGNYAFHGYDTLIYFMGALKDLGSDIVKYIPFYPEQRLLQSNIKFKRIEGGGLVNTATRDVRYDKETMTVTVE
jgi:FOG: LysM repeat